MARGRMLNRVVAKDGRVAAYGDDAGPMGLVFHHRLIAFLDVNGNVDADPFWLKGNVMPRVRGCSPDDIRQLTAALVRHRLAAAYTVDGNTYLHFAGFRTNQPGLRRDREKPEVPVPQGFDEVAGDLPADIRDVPADVPRKDEVEVEVEVEVTDLSADADAAVWMHSMWVEKFNRKRVNLTPKRKQFYNLMFREHLRKAVNPQLAWAAVLSALAASPHHMSNTDYSLPESFLGGKQPIERRERWMNKAIEIALAEKSGIGPGDLRLVREVQRLDDVDLGAA